MTEILIAMAALAAGVVGGVLIALRTGRTPAAEERVEGWLQAHGAELRRLGDAARARDGAEERLRAEVQAARQVVEALRIRDEERRVTDGQHAEVVRRLATVLAGASSKGRAGENLLREQLAGLPPGMLEPEFRVNGKVVEYGLLLPDGRRLPIDSKWPALRELEALEAAKDPVEREARTREIERIVAGRAREVAAYLDPAITAPVAVAAVPDAAYALLRRAHADAFSRGVVIVPYSAALPVLLFLYSLVARYGGDTPTADVQGCLSEVAAVLEAMESVLENKLVRAATMLGNGADELRACLGKGRGSIARARGGPGEDGGAPSGEGSEAEDLLHLVQT